MWSRKGHDLAYDRAVPTGVPTSSSFWLYSNVSSVYSFVTNQFLFALSQEYVVLVLYPSAERFASLPGWYVNG